MKNIPLLIVAFIFVLGCSSVKTVKTQMSPTELPEEMPDGLIVSYNEDHGMSPSWYEIEIKNDELVVTKKKASEDRETVRFLAISSNEQAAIYKVFRDNRFDLIENEKPEDIAYDAGGDSIRLRVGKISHRVSSGMNSPIADGMASNYRAVRKALQDFVKTKENDLIEFPKNAIQFPYRKKLHGSIIANGVRFTATLSELQKAHAATIEELKKRKGFNVDAEELLIQLVPYKIGEDQKILATGFVGKPRKQIDRNPVDKSMTDQKIFRVFLDLPDMVVTKFSAK